MKTFTSVSLKKIPYGPVTTALIFVCRIGIFLMNAFSFYTTAVGMTGFVFSSIVASMAVSLTIQMALLVFDFWLPHRLSRLSHERKQYGWKRAIASFFSVFLPFFMYLILLFVSSGFSYVYISSDIYKPIWSDTIRQVMVSDYRDSLYSDQDAVEQALERQSNAIEDSVQSVAEIASDASAQTQQSYTQSLVQVVQAVPGTVTGYAIEGDNLYQTLLQYATQADTALSDQNTPQIQSVQEDLEDWNQQMTSEQTSLQDQLNQQSVYIDTLNNQISGISRNGYRDDWEDANQMRTEAMNDQNSTKQKSDAYSVLANAYKTVRNRVDSYLGSSSGEAGSATDELQRQLLGDKDVQIMKQQVGVLVNYVQDSQGNPEATALLSDVVALNDQVEDFGTLVQLQDYLAGEVQSLATVDQDLQQQIDEALTDRAEEAPEDVELDVTQQFWRTKLEDLRDHLTQMPAEQLPDDGETDAETGADTVSFREKASAELDSLLNLYLVDNSKLRTAINFFRLPGSYIWEAYIALILAFLLDIVPMLLNTLVAYLKRTGKPQDA